MNNSIKQHLDKPVCPPSTQAELFGYLKPEQQAVVQPILRVLKKPAQEELCCALLDYLEHGEENPPHDLVLGSLFCYITRTGGIFNDDPDDKSIVRPLHYWNVCHASTFVWLKRLFSKL